MKNVELLPHNEKTYVALNNTLMNNQMASINHATGTGKSFILLKYMYERKEKRILYIAPTYPIIDQLINDHMNELGIDKSEFTKLDTMTYAGLLNKDMKALASQYDVIVLDEYHRCGARLWGKQVHDLLDTVEKSYPDTKVIGTTATEIRYLDKERNMNNILFKGVEASRLTLADAILDEILPAPLYISFNISLLDDLKRIEEDIEKYAFYNEDKEKYLKEIQAYRRELESTIYNNKSILDYLEGCKKILVFSRSINSIPHDKSFMNRLLKKHANNFIVHSGISREENRKSLREFRDIPKDDYSILYSIDILNEGVHVKGADAAILRRRTTSPIIYFQQLGRLLSYSRRKDNVVIIDMVNNIRRHPVIYELYQDVVERAKELIKLHPENKERYERILERFKIVNETSILSEKMDDLKSYYSKNAIMERRLLTAVKILSDEHYPNEVEKFQARVDIIKYSDYITVPIFEKIQALKGISKPPIMKFTKEEFILFLQGNRNIKEKNTLHLKELYKEIQVFYDNNYRLPTIFSDNEEEKELAIKVVNNLYNYSQTMISFIKDNLTEELSLFERVNYGEKIDNIDYDLLIKEMNQAIKMNVKISHYTYFALKDKIDKKKLDEIVINRRSKDELEDMLFDVYFEETNKKRKEDFYNQGIFEEVAVKILEETKNKDLDKYVDKVFREIIDFMKKYQKDIEFNSPLTNMDEAKLERELYCKKIILHSKLVEKGYLKKIEELSLYIKTRNEYIEMSVLVDNLIRFIKEHTGSLPSSKNRRIEGERELALSYAKNYSKIPADLKKKIFKEQDKYPNKRREVLNTYIDFVRKNRRKPSFDEKYLDEYILNEELNRWEMYFTNEEKAMLDKTIKSVNKYEAIRNSYYAIQQKKNGK